MEVTAPDRQKVVGFLTSVGNGKYTISLNTSLTGNLTNIGEIASDQVLAGNINNSQYVITTEHYFRIAF